MALAAPGNGRVEIANILENDVGRFAAEFEADLFQISRRGANDDFPNFSRAGEGDFVHVVMSGQRGAGRFAETGDDVDDAFRNAGFEKNLAEAKRGQRRLFGGFEDNAISRRQRRRRVSTPPSAAENSTE